MSKTTESQSTNGDETIPDSEWNPTVGSLIPDGRSLVSVCPDDELAKATELMTSNNYSQLAVMEGPSAIKVTGAISWKSIGASYMSEPQSGKVQDFTEPCQIVSADSPIFDVTQIIADYDFVLVKDVQNAITGIVTASDLSIAFRDLFEPLHLSGAAELGIRRIFLNANFDPIELQGALSRQQSKGKVLFDVGELTIGQFNKLIDDDEYWNRLNVTGVDRSSFRRCLSKLSPIRNSVMHFRVRKLNDEDMGFLRRFSKFLRGNMALESK